MRTHLGSHIKDGQGCFCCHCKGEILHCHSKNQDGSETFSHRYNFIAEALGTLVWGWLGCNELVLMWRWECWRKILYVHPPCCCSWVSCPSQPNLVSHWCPQKVFGALQGGALQSRRKILSSAGLTTSDNVFERRQKTDYLSHSVLALRAQHRQLESDLTIISFHLLPPMLPVVLLALRWPAWCLCQIQKAV